MANRLKTLMRLQARLAILGYILFVAGLNAESGWSFYASGGGGKGQFSADLLPAQIAVNSVLAFSVPDSPELRQYQNLALWESSKESGIETEEWYANLGAERVFGENEQWSLQIGLSHGQSRVHCLRNCAPFSQIAGLQFLTDSSSTPTIPGNPAPFLALLPYILSNKELQQNYWMLEAGLTHFLLPGSTVSPLLGIKGAAGICTLEMEVDRCFGYRWQPFAGIRYRINSLLSVKIQGGYRFQHIELSSRGFSVTLDNDEAVMVDAGISFSI